MPAAISAGPGGCGPNKRFDTQGTDFAVAAADTDYVDAAGTANSAAANCTVGNAAAEAVAADTGRRSDSCPDDRRSNACRPNCGFDPMFAAVVAEPAGTVAVQYPRAVVVDGALLLSTAAAFAAAELSPRNSADAGPAVAAVAHWLLDRHFAAVGAELPFAADKPHARCRFAEPGVVAAELDAAAVQLGAALAEPASAVVVAELAHCHGRDLLHHAAFVLVCLRRFAFSIGPAAHWRSDLPREITLQRTTNRFSSLILCSLISPS